MSIKNKELEENDLLTIIHAAVRDRGLAGHHIDSLNYFTKDGLKQIITKFFGIDHRFINKRVTTPEDQSIESIHFKLTYPTIEMEPTKILNGDSEELMTPKTARDRGLTYGANIFIGVNCVFTANLRAGGTKVRTVSLENLPLSALPIGVKTDMCALTVMPREALLAGGEDPNDPGGYFIIKGTEWVVTCLENQCFNNLSIYRSDKIENERVRGTIITKAGDAFEHTYQSIFKLLKDDRIVFEITLNKKEVIILPFFALFRIFGVSSDSEIMEYILCNDTDTQDELTIVMRNFLENAFDANYGETEHFKDILDQPSTLLAIAKLKTKELLNENNLNNEDICKHYIEPIIEIFDKRVLQQYGTGVNDRKTKAVIVGRYYRDIIMVHLGLAPITDRDSMKIKRMHAAGITLSKSLKSQFNQVVNLPVKKRLMKVLEAESFSTADLASAIHSIIITEGQS
jgi:DNA-directed RNA polymerase beta subunit